MGFRTDTKYVFTDAIKIIKKICTEICTEMWQKQSKEANAVQKETTFVSFTAVE
jgi:hypothetical protein